MTTMLTQEEKQAKLEEWYAAQQAAAEAKPIIEREQELRKEVAAMFFPGADEGTNYLDLADGWKLKATIKLTRKLDEAVLPTVMQELRNTGVNTDPLLSFKPSLDTKAYTALSDAAKAIFDNALITTPGSPTLELVPPKKKA